MLCGLSLISSSFNFRQSEAEQSRSEDGCHSNPKTVPDVLGVSNCGTKSGGQMRQVNYSVRMDGRKCRRLLPASECHLLCEIPCMYPHGNGNREDS